MNNDSYDDITEIIFKNNEDEDDIRIAEPKDTGNDDDIRIAEPRTRKHDDTDILNFIMPDEPEDESDEFIDQIGESIAKQMDEDIPEIDMSDTQTESLFSEKIKVEKWYEKYPKWVIPTALGGVILVIICLIIFGTPLIRNMLIDKASDIASEKMNYVPLEEHTDPVTPQITLALISTPVPSPEISSEATLGAITDGVRKEEYSRNILLVGEETLGDTEGRGRTDLLIIATVNTKNRSISFTSIMRDLLVEIPGHGDYSINKAYQFGGMELLFETIENNFYIALDGYMKIGFNSFEKIVDNMGGIELELTETEAGYLNSTNYISDVESRNVKSGRNILNGSQALGYCRIRSVGTDNLEYNDFGRTTRQKRVLKALLNKCETMNYVDLLITMNECLPMITTDLDNSELSECIKAAYGIGLKSNIVSNRIPTAGSYQEVKLRGEDVLMPDMEKNIRELHIYLFGNYIGDVIPTEGPSVTLLAVPTQQP